MTTDHVDPRLGLSRRDLLRRGAIVGGTLVWAAPAVQTLARPAFGQTAGTPEDGQGRDFSYVALRYTCGGAGPYAIKFDFGTDGGGNPVVEKCSTGNFRTPRGQNTDCDFDRSGLQTNNSAHCTDGTFVPTFHNNDLKTITISMAHNSDCIIEGVGVGKCASPAAVPEPCVYVDAGPEGTQSITFRLCGT